MIFITVLNRIYTTEVLSKEKQDYLSNNSTGYITVGTEDQFFINSDIIHNKQFPPITFMSIGVDIKNFRI